MVSGAVRFNSDVTIFGNLSSSGTQTFANTVFSTTSALSVVHVGSGPALYVGNNGNGDIASFYDIDQNVEILHVGGNNGSHPNVGVKTSTPNVTLTVNGEISAASNIYATGLELRQDTISSQTRIGLIRDFDNASGSEISFLKRRNLSNIPLSANDSLGVISFAGPFFAGASIEAKVDDLSQNNISSPTSLSFSTGTSAVNSNTTRMTIRSSGNVGINTTIPNERLTVLGNVSSSNVIYDSAGNSNQWNDVCTSYSNVSARVIVDSGNTRSQNMSIGTNDAYNLRLKTNGNSSRFTLLSSGEVGIGTTLAETAAAGSGGLVVKNDLVVGGAQRPSGSMLPQVKNRSFSDVAGMSPEGFDWWGGTVPNWDGPTHPDFTIYLDINGYYRNLNAGPTGPGNQSARQTIGTLRSTSDVILNFSNNYVGAFGVGTLSAAIYDTSFTVYASGAFDGYGTKTLSAANVPAFTNVMIGFWGNTALNNISLTANNASKNLTISGGISATHTSTARFEVRDGIVIFSNLPTSSTGLPVGALWNSGGTLRIV